MGWTWYLNETLLDHPKPMPSCVTTTLVLIAELFAHSGTFTIVNQAYRESLADRSSDDYKQLSAKIVAQVINNATHIAVRDCNSGY